MAFADKGTPMRKGKQQRKSPSAATGLFRCMNRHIAMLPTADNEALVASLKKTTDIVDIVPKTGNVGQRFTCSECGRPMTPLQRAGDAGPS